jgi:hypothetical protein
LGVTARENVEDVLSHFTHACKKGIPEGGLCSINLFQMRDFFQPEQSWEFNVGTDAIGMLYCVISSMNFMANHLEAFKESRADTPKTLQQQLLKTDVMRLKEEGAPRRPKEDGAAKTAKLGLSMKSLTKYGAYTAEIQSIVKDSHQAYQSKGIPTPEFMQKFLADMASKEVDMTQGKKVGVPEFMRTEAVRTLRDWCCALREETLLPLGDYLFGELCARCLTNLQSRTKETTAATVQEWAENDQQRQDHERALRPDLADPNMKEELKELMRMEAKRHKAALARAVSDRERMAACLRDTSGYFVARLAARFEAAMYVVDAIPLRSNFLPLPADERADDARISIKRRFRHMQATGGLPENFGTGVLPERQWPGVPRFELRRCVRDGAWPPDTELDEQEAKALQPPEPDPKAKAAPKAAAAKGAKAQEVPEPPKDDPELTPTMASYRSPVHKKLFERRCFFYDRYKEAFIAELKRRGDALAARENLEKAGQQNWASMVCQLRGGEPIETLGLEDDEENAGNQEPPAPAEQLPRTKAGKK